MRVPSDQIHGPASFTSEVRKQPEGDYVARNVSMPEVPAQRAPSEREAIERLTQATIQWIGNGCVGERCK